MNTSASPFLRAFVGVPGIWVNVHGTWERPLSVFLYRGAWCVVCRACRAPIHSGASPYFPGWPTVEQAFAAALTHCKSMEVTS